MHKLGFASLALAAALALPAIAAAKGPESASISGPGLGRSLAVAGDGEMGAGTPLGSLVDLGGFFPQMYGQSPNPTLKHQPRGTLGPGYAVTYVVPGPNGIKSRVVQMVYPYAKPVPLTFMRPGQTYWGNRLTVGGWFRSAADLKKALVAFGLPETPPSKPAGLATMGVIGGIAGAAVLMGLLVAVTVRRRRAT